MRDYYEILGVARNASKAEIQAVFYKLAHIYHPDKGGNERKFKEVNEAYGVLSNDKKRAEYDAQTNQQNKSDNYSTKNKSTSTTRTPSREDGHKWRNILVIVGIVVFFALTNSSGNNSNLTPTHTAGTSDIDSNVLAIPSIKTDDQLCKESYGLYSYSTGKKNVDGGPKCDCQNKYEWNDAHTACVAIPLPKSGYEICQDRNGSFATYDSASNSCGCVSGYSLGVVSKRCVSFMVARDESCESSYPGTSFLKYDLNDNKSICDCKSDYYWNNDRTACYSLASFNQSCVNAYGSGSYSITEMGKRVCSCSYGYDWNSQRTTCVTIQSINQICERDVGRNSRYAGSSSNGKYSCTEPY